MSSFFPRKAKSYLRNYDSAICLSTYPFSSILFCRELLAITFTHEDGVRIVHFIRLL